MRNAYSTVPAAALAAVLVSAVIGLFGLAAAGPGLSAEHEEPGKAKLLVASKSIRDPLFAESVILVLSYDRRGAMGVIINKPTGVKLSMIVPDLELPPAKDDVVFRGGPVARDEVALLILTSAPPNGAAPVFGDVYLTSSGEALRRMIETPRPAERFRLFAGYAGWAPGQLEYEIERGDWIIMSATAELIFDRDPSGLWDRLMHRNFILEARARNDGFLLTAGPQIPQPSIPPGGEWL